MGTKVVVPLEFGWSGAVALPVRRPTLRVDGSDCWCAVCNIGVQPAWAVREGRKGS